MKINANFQLFAATHFDASKYISSPSLGVNRFMLDRIGNEKARATTIVEYQPNSKFPTHVHIGGEEFLVLEGTFKDHHGSFSKGTYVRNPIGSEHAPWVDEDGCTIMVKLLQMAEEGSTTPLHVNLEQAKAESGQATEYGLFIELYKNKNTGEHVRMCWLDAGKTLPVDEEALNGGEELFVVEGSIMLDSGSDKKSDEKEEKEYHKWGWIRFPVGGDPRRDLLRAGIQGAQVYRKMGHLTEKALSMEKIQIDADTETVIE